MKDRYAIIILAAGASSRMGRPKQTLPFKQSTLLGYSIDAALHSIADEVIVVLGAGAELVQPPIQNIKLSFIVNEQWEEGMASSIRCGLQVLLAKDPPVEAALLMVCDQPYINTAILDKLVTLHGKTGSGIVACRYENTLGIPAVFGKQLFPELLKLKGDTGAKNIIMRHAESRVVVDFPPGAIDIDTQEAYKKISEHEKN